MTVSTTTGIKLLTADGVSTNFLFDFQTLSATHITAYVDGVEDTNTTVTLNADQDLNPGGDVEFDVDTPPNLSTVSIVRTVPLLQDIAYPVGGPFPSATHEAGLDELTMIAQDTRELITRTLRFPTAEDPAVYDGEIPVAVDRASTILSFSATGTIALIAADSTIPVGYNDLAFSATPVFDLTNGVTTLFGDVTAAITSMTTSNRGKGRGTDIIMKADGTDRALTLNPNWVVVGLVPTILPANKTGILSLRCKGSAETDVIATWAGEL